MSYIFNMLGLKFVRNWGTNLALEIDVWETCLYVQKLLQKYLCMKIEQKGEKNSEEIHYLKKIQ